MKFEMKVEPKYLYAKLAGEFSLTEAKAAFLVLMDAVEKNRCKNIMVDGREVTGHLRTLERFLYGEFVANAVYKRGLSYIPRFAYVLEPPILDPNKFGETVARNRGMMVKAFDRLRDALEYIEDMPQSDPPRT